jgi:syntaxin 1B/2/3
LRAEAREKIQEEVDEVNKVAAESKRRIEALDKENEEARKEPGCGPGSSQDRTRTSITTSLKKKLKDLTGEFQELRAKFHEDQKEQVTRWHYTATGQEISDEKAEEMIESGESEKLFQKEFLEQGRGQIIETVQEIRERREAVREMERKLYELHQIFLDMASLVESQGEMLDNVEESVNKSVDYVQRGTKDLKQAKDLQKSSRKWMCCGIIVFLVIMAVVLGPALSSAGSLS